MCTCVFVKNKDSYFMRNLDYHLSYGERVIFIGRKFKLNFKREKSVNEHFSIIGTGTIIDGYPMFADAINEKGLAIAGLNFIGNATYYEYKESKVNITPYELPLYLLGTCASIKDVKEKLKEINLLNVEFSPKIPLASLHFMISDINESIVLESTKEGIKIYDNHFGVLTNNPEFNYHKNNVYNFMHLSINDPINNFDKNNDLIPISYGQGAIGIPGDYSSQSRFIKALFVKNNILLDDENRLSEDIFYILDSVLMPKGLVKVGEEYEYTRYSVCYNLNERIMCYKTYNNRSISSIEMDYLNKDLDKIIEFSLE